MEQKFNMESSIERMKQMASAIGIELQKGVSDDLIDRFEKKMDVKLPDDFRQFYYFTNGTEGHYFRDEIKNGGNLLGFISLDEVMENYDSGYDTGQGEFVFAEFLIYSDTWTVIIDKDNHNNYIITNSGINTNRVDFTHVLAEFLERYLDGGAYDGIYKWEDEIKRNKHP